ncbi:hypothetical protein [Spectribacter hydrogenoxidans]|uniref:Uncharacterized protein n=1 Tax=Spectribacter hydrogenoxidans TaxID=3075608 RepID=A0ABU3BYR8_9GAMM|nr:hypothetical protein [Salinisphaera sp. W335]MDT0634462.1 hypothetical protein [Salinisphaera sp. W335]
MGSDPASLRQLLPLDERATDFLAQLAEADRQRLSDQVTDAAAAQRQSLEDAIDQAAGFVPGPLRRTARKLLLG